MPVAEQFDLDADSRRALEFDELLTWIASFARTRPGELRVRALEPTAVAHRIDAELATVEEMRVCLASDGRLIGGGGLADPAPALQVLRVDGAGLEPGVLRGLASVLMAVSGLRRRLCGLEAESHPNLHRLGESLADLSVEAEEILRCIEPDGRLSDDASAELRRIRSSHAAIGERLARMLESYFRDPDTSSLVQDEFVTQRNGRFVIPVRTDAHRPLTGIVHASSSSGATQFVEPLETVELNNELVRLHEQEQEEQERILLGWSEALRYRRVEVEQAVEGLAVIDSLQARALFAEASAAVRPAVSEGGPLVLGAVRHPLLQRKLHETDGECVPLDLRLDVFDQALVLSGPNTGGKTVAIKTVGLTVLMAQAGIPVTGAAVRLPLYRQLRADIGDHQSIEADLSTYSAHVRAVVAYLRDANPPALFLFDEIGGGTEPVEGAALAQSILEALLRPGMTTVATTHQGALKAWAFTTAGATSAAMEFDAELMRPTYRILMGAAGVSAGLEIAERLGLDPRIVADARARLGEGDRQSEHYLNRLRDLTVEAEGRRDSVARREAELVEERQRLQLRAESEGRRRRQSVESALDRVLNEFRVLAKQEVAAVRDKRERRRAERDLARLEQRLRMERGRRVDEVAPAVDGDSAPSWSVPGAVCEGMVVYVHSLAREGRVSAVRGDEVDVQLGKVPFTVRRSDLRIRRGSEPSSVKATAGPPSEGPARAIAGSYTPQESEDAPREIKLIGLTVDEALPELDKFMDSAALAGHADVRVIHGHGTGKLREAVREFLRGHVHVAGQRPGKPREGGNGATVVRLK